MQRRTTSKSAVEASPEPFGRIGFVCFTICLFDCVDIDTGDDKTTPLQHILPDEICLVGWQSTDFATVGHTNLLFSRSILPNKMPAKGRGYCKFRATAKTMPNRLVGRMNRLDARDERWWRSHFRLVNVPYLSRRLVPHRKVHVQAISNTA
jgi:hypothetical protein